jgi:hypothetical protein
MRLYMKPRFVVIVVCIIVVVGLLAVAAGVSTAQQPDLDHFVYLPIVARPPCEDRTVSAWIMADRPVVRVGETFTVTIAVVSEGCADIFDIEALAGAGLTSPKTGMETLYPPDLHPGEYGEIQITFEAISPGVDILYGGAYFNYEHRPRGWTESIDAKPTPIRVLP